MSTPEQHSPVSRPLFHGTGVAFGFKHHHSVDFSEVAKGDVIKQYQTATYREPSFPAGDPVIFFWETGVSVKPLPNRLML